MKPFSSPGSPYLQLEFTAEDDMTAASDSEHPAECTNGSHQAVSAGLGGSPGSPVRQVRAVDTRPRAIVVSTGAFFVALLLLMFITGFSCRSFVGGILRILEEEVDLTGGETLAIVLSYDIGFLIVLLIMALQNSKIHRPKSIGFGGFLIGVGLLIVCIPYFIVRSDLTEGQWYVSKYELCEETTSSPGNQSSSPGGKSDQEPPEAHWNSVAWIVMGLVLCGIGAVPQFPLGITYLEDRLHGFGTPFYVAMFLCAYLLGIWFGELANLFMWHHVANATSTTVALWWLGFFCSALVALVIGVFIFMAKDPYKRLVKEAKRGLSGVSNWSQNGQQYRRLQTDDERREASRQLQPRWRRILTNIQLLCLAMGGSLEVAVMTGFLVFLPRYMGTISNLGRGPARFYIGTTVISSACIGILTSSGFTLYKKVKWRGLSRMVITGCTVAALFTWPLYLFRCTDPLIVGGDISVLNRNVDKFWRENNSTMQCNAACSCAKLPYRPVCGSDGRTYMSPCMAGCHLEQSSDVIDSQGLKLTNFTECSCVMTPDTAVHAQEELGYAISGACASDCSNEWPFFGVVFVVFLMTGVQFGPMILLSTRCVIRADRIAAISFQVIMWHIIGYVPAVICFSVILNQSCVIWGRPEAQYYHECALYDSYHHNVFFVTVVFLLKVLSLGLYFISYNSMKRRDSHVNIEWGEYDTVEMDHIDNNTTTRPSYL